MCVTAVERASDCYRCKNYIIQISDIMHAWAEGYCSCMLQICQLTQTVTAVSVTDVDIGVTVTSVYATDTAINI